MTVALKDGTDDLWHRPETPNGTGLVLTHGAGGNARAPLLQALATACCSAGVTVVRYDLPFRRKRSGGPPHPAAAAEDRAGILEMAREMRGVAGGPVVIGGHSYGGRQASILASDNAGAADGLLLLSYPLHPPGKPAQLRTEHFPRIHAPILFVSGTRDEFGSQMEFEREIPQIPAEVRMLWIESAGHDLKRGKFDLAELVNFVAKIPPKKFG